MADKLEIPVLHGPSTKCADGRIDPAICVASAPRVCSHLTADSAHSHSGGRHSTEVTGQG